MKESKRPPRVSCLLPVYNGASFLEEAIESILCQTFADFELVVVDDGSTDSTPAILRNFAERDARMRVLTQPNGGIVAALNAGLAVCRGTYIARMDADDLALPDRFAFQVAHLDEHDDCVLVGGQAIAFETDGARPVQRAITSGGRHRRTDLSVFPPRIAVAMHPLIMVRRASLLSVDGYRGDFPHAEDYDLFIRLANLGRIDNPPRAMLKYRRHPGAISLQHLDVQERNAASAELAAMVGAGEPNVPAWLFEPYVRLRVWRRTQSADPKRAKAMLPVMLRDLLDARPRTLLSRRYLRLRAIILAGMFRSGRRLLRTAIGANR